MLKVGLTGGIACGKSYSLRRFKTVGANTIDADLIARKVVRPNQPALQEIVDEFGERILQEDGTLHREKLANLIFNDSTAREKLNRITHPHILKKERSRIAELESEQHHLTSPIIIVDAALMIESGSYRNYDFLIVVYCSPAIQLARLMKRDNVSEHEALKRIHSQMPIFEKIRYGDYIIETSGKMSETDQQIKQVYLELIQHWEESQSA